jgi:carbonic anhydrase
VAVPAKGAVTVAVAQKHGTPNYALVQGANKTRDVAVGGLDASGGVALDGVPYAFSSLHFHTPAENTLDGAANAMEMHLVHFAADGSGAIAVLGVLFRYADEENPADKTVERLLADVAADGGKRRVKIEPGALWDSASGYFRWQGSLTTPPCTGGVSWVLQKEVRTVSRAAVKRFREHLGDGAFPGNARPTQPLNARAVRAFEPKSA